MSTTCLSRFRKCIVSLAFAVLGCCLLSFGGSAAAAAENPAVTASISTETSGTANAGSPVVVSPFGPIHLVASRRQYTGDKCPIDITYTASINFKAPLPKNFSFTYHWERSDGAKTPEQVATPAGQRAMSVREVWKLGAPGQEYNASMKLFIDSGGTHVIKASPDVKVVCK